MQDYKLLIAGGADFNQYELLKTSVNELLNGRSGSFEIIIISGVAQGAGMLGERYAAEKGYEVAEFYKIKNEGPNEHHSRQVEMTRFADACICFWDGTSACTKHIMDLINGQNTPLSVISY